MERASVGTNTILLLAPGCALAPPTKISLLTAQEFCPFLAQILQTMVLKSRVIEAFCIRETEVDSF